MPILMSSPHLKVRRDVRRGGPSGPPRL